MGLFPKLFSLPMLIVIAWLGSNLYFGNELFANPFVEQEILETIKENAGEMVDDSIEDAKDSL
ncbi:hypothetical protein A9R00_10165 [Oleispira antarctica]|uniref:Uncharacterized protein n=1 Tax=Oleispira antarctica TaxID=188908 RepID=A0A1Y5HSX7_OLEAN|nr:hypothetical protein A9R00_10165 [Oleispira antarctica]